VWDQEIGGGRSPLQSMGSPKKSCRKVFILAAWAVAPSCWNQHEFGHRILVIFRTNYLIHRRTVPQLAVETLCTARQSSVNARQFRALRVHFHNSSRLFCLFM
jgi:hypothetical protein